MKKLLSLFIFIRITITMHAQDVQMADAMKENGKIYVVIAVMLTILAGLVIYLVRLDKKISRLENKQ
jgi:hypothetical protein